MLETLTLLKLLSQARDFYQSPDNQRAYESWKQKQTEETKMMSISKNGAGISYYFDTEMAKQDFEALSKEEQFDLIESGVFDCADGIYVTRLHFIEDDTYIEARVPYDDVKDNPSFIAETSADSPWNNNGKWATPTAVLEILTELVIGYY